MKKNLFIVYVIALFSALSLSSCIGKSNEIEFVDIYDSGTSDIEALDSLAAALDSAAKELDSISRR